MWVFRKLPNSTQSRQHNNLCYADCRIWIYTTLVMQIQDIGFTSVSTFYISTHMVFTNFLKAKPAVIVITLHICKATCRRQYELSRINFSYPTSVHSKYTRRRRKYVVNFLGYFYFHKKVQLLKIFLENY
jgi:hypothetical protein